MRITRFLPQWLKNTLRIAYTAFAYFLENQYWFWFDILNSSAAISNKKSDLALLMIMSHVLEKGITMPNRRLGFGYDRVRSIIVHATNAIKQYPIECIEIQSTLKDLEQYLQIHQDANFHLPVDIESGIKNLLEHKIKDTKKCFEITSEDYFTPNNDYGEFTHQRHSVRWYDDQKVNHETLYKAIELAQAAPSACNRQSTRVYVIEDAAKKEAVLNLQNGNRGFGYLADKIILLTADMRYWNYKERTSSFLDAGIFCMSLLNALHYYHIGACTLNAHLSISQRKLLRDIVGYSKTEIPVVFISIGNVPQKFMICGSQRLETEQIFKFV